MKKWMLLLAVPALLAAQEAKDQPKEQPKKYYQKSFDLKYVDTRRMFQILEVLRMGPMVANITLQQEMRVVAVGTPDPDVLTAAEQLVKRYDVPANAGNRNIELTFYMLLAAPAGTAGDALPADLAPVAKQLQNVFGYKDLRLLDAALIRSREKESGQTSGNAQAPAGGTRPMMYQISYRSAEVQAGEKGNSIRLDSFKLSLRVPVENGFSDVNINTNLDVREGQKVVVGKSKLDGTDKAFILVVTAKAVD